MGSQIRTNNAGGAYRLSTIMLYKQQPILKEPKNV